MVGCWRDPWGNVQHPANPAMSYGTGLHLRNHQDQRAADWHGAGTWIYDDNPERRGTGSGSGR